MYDLVDENNVLFDKQTIKRHNSRELNNNEPALLRRTVSFSNTIRCKCSKLLTLTPHLHRRGQQDKDSMGVSLMSTNYQRNGASRLKKKFSGPDILTERRKSLKGMTR